MNSNLAQKFANKMKQLAQSQFNPPEPSHQSTPLSQNQLDNNSFPQEEEQFSDVNDFDEICSNKGPDSQMDDIDEIQSNSPRKSINVAKKNDVARKSAPVNFQKIINRQSKKIMEKNIGGEVKSKIASYNPTKIAINIRLQNMPSSARVLQINKKQKRHQQKKKISPSYEELDHFQQISDSEIEEQQKYEQQEIEPFQEPISQKVHEKKQKYKGKTSNVKINKVLQEQKRQLEEEKKLIEREKKMIENQRKKIQMERKKTEEEKRKKKKKQEEPKEKEKNNDFNNSQIQLIKNICQESVFEKMEVMIDKITDKLKVNAQTAIKAVGDYDEQRRLPSKKRHLTYEREDDSEQFILQKQKYKRASEPIVIQKALGQRDYLDQEEQIFQKNPLISKNIRKQSHDEKLERILKQVTKRVNTFEEKQKKKMTPIDELKKLLVNEALEIIQSYEDLVEDDKQKIMDQWIDEKKKEQKKNSLRSKYAL